MASELPFYIGTRTHKTQSKGIYTAKLDIDSGEMKEMRLAAEAANPSFLAVSSDGFRVYAATSDFDVVAFARERDETLVPLNAAGPGGGMCHVAIDRFGKVVFGANYGAGTVAGYKIEGDGSLGAQSSFHQFSGSGPNPLRQQKAHAHSIFASPDNRFVYVCDLGCDKIWIFRLNVETGVLTAADPVFGIAPAGGGPRHLVFSDDKIYANNELPSSVTVYRRDVASGALEQLQTLPTLEQPNEKSTNSAIKLHPSGKWLYISNRGSDTVAVFTVEADGKLSLIQDHPAEVVCPRDFEIDPTGNWLLAAGQKDHQIASHRIDCATGRLAATGYRLDVDEPVCIVFPPLT